jgi:hypothetical protein
VPQDSARDAAERTLAALTEQNQRLGGEKAAAEAQARDAMVRSRGQGLPSCAADKGRAQLCCSCP